jgi:hypothetical protein
MPMKRPTVVTEVGRPEAVWMCNFGEADHDLADLWQKRTPSLH